MVINDVIKIVTLNLCLGLKSKKLEVERLLKDQSVNSFCLQEVEIENSFDENLLSLSGYNFELESNSLKSRTGIYVSKDINYKRMRTLEGVNSITSLVKSPLNG